ncbi:hypothetical protein K6T82_18835 [Flavobacterium sp. 17A]|uniref:Uncharacterized protein n=1 Tax=Flavobacterium potami TaxID=2872310 RepID=A0A9X1KRD1_9FLAO|nr:hypothetical protein [Flavobacterium potami]MBZ4036833.1 hypothetical protein [Flavobacterium potami]
MTKKIFQFLMIGFCICGLYAQKSTGLDETKEKFYKNAKKANLTDTKTKELLQIIEERNLVLKDLDTKKKQADAPYSIQDPGTLYNFKINNARNYYARKINGFLTYKEYCEFMADDYKNEARQDAKPEYENLFNSNRHLTEDQKQKLYEFVYNYHLNQLLTAAYYGFDKTIQKPKLGVLRFNFEKEFKRLCKEYNVKSSDSNAGNTNGFEWN